MLVEKILINIIDFNGQVYWVRYIVIILAKRNYFYSFFWLSYNQLI